jgi:hypothetical protein
MKAACEQSEYRKNPEANITLSAKRTEISQMSNEGTGRKYETNWLFGLILDRRKKNMANYTV